MLYFQTCKRSTASEIVCRTPNLVSYIDQSPLFYGFVLDNINSYSNVGQLIVTDDPTIKPGEDEEFKNTFDKTFTISVRVNNNSVKFIQQTFQMHG